MISSYIQSILFPATIACNPIHDHLDGIVEVKHCSKHIVHVVSMSSPVNLERETRESTDLVMC
jgi:hypothetical protein